MNKLIIFLLMYGSVYANDVVYTQTASAYTQSCLCARYAYFPGDPNWDKDYQAWLDDENDNSSPEQFDVHGWAYYESVDKVWDDQNRNGCEEHH